MLQALHIENVAVIKCVDIELEDGFVVLTGETGAGKSILIDSVNLLLGGKSDRGLIRTGEKQALVSAVFDGLSESVLHELAALGFAAEDGCVLLQRTLQADGKSSMRLNGKPLTATVAREVGRLLLNIHGQNDNQRLLQKATHLQLLDAVGVRADGKAGEAYLAAQDAYRTAYDALCDSQRELEELDRDDAEKLRLKEMLEYQIRDIEALKLKVGEEQALERERDRLQHMEKIEKHVNFTTQVLDSREKNASVCYLLLRSVNSLRQISDVIPEAESLAAQLEDMMYQVRDVAEQVSDWTQDSVDNPTARLDAIEGRLEAISRLQRKYGPSVADILAFCDRAKQQLQQLDTAEERCTELREQCARQREQCMALAKTLTEKRQAAAEYLTEQMTKELSFLDMPKVRFAVSLRPSEELLPSGRDDVEFLIATNAGEPLMPMIKIASGGELARLMLALKSVLNDCDGVGTVVFDEIDTGISGKTSRKIGIRLRQMGHRTQVICITHSAQIASLADCHGVIGKHEVNGRTETHVAFPDEEGRVQEIARILGGLEITEAQRCAAREMLDERRAY